MSITKSKPSDRIVNKLHKLGFNYVTKIKDADEPIWVKVTKWDTQNGSKKSSENCALARACVREKQADGAVINIGTSYIIKGNVATRYKTSAGVGREITSFDRGAGFEPGEDYLLASMPPASRLDATPRTQRPSGPHENHKPGKKPNVHRHHTENIRINRALPKKK